MVYRRLSLEDELFTSGVYKRNYRIPFQTKLNSDEPAYEGCNTDKTQIPRRISDSGNSMLLAPVDATDEPTAYTRRLHPRDRINSPRPDDNDDRHCPFHKRENTTNEGRCEWIQSDKVRTQHNRNVQSGTRSESPEAAILTLASQEQRKSQTNRESRSGDECSEHSLERMPSMQEAIIMQVLQAHASACCNTSHRSYTVLLISVLKEFGVQAAFHKAVEDVQYEHLMFLLVYGAVVNNDCLIDSNIISAVKFSMSQGDIAMTKLLLRFRERPAFPMPIYLLWSAIRLQYHSEMIIMMLNAGISFDSNSHQNLGYQALHEICGWRSAPGVIKEFIRRGADLEARTAVGYRKTPLQIARSTPFLANVKALLELGAKDNTTAPQSESPLHTALLSRSIARLAGPLDLGENPNACAPKSGLPSVLLLASAVCGGFNESDADRALFSTLIKYNADLKAQDRHGNNILHFLVQPTWYERPRSTSKARARRDLIRYLISCGGDCNTLDNRGETPLSLAVKFLNAPLVEEMLELGGHLRPSEILRLRIRLHEMHSKSFLRVSESNLVQGMSFDRDLDVNDMLRLLKGERGFLMPRLIKVAPRSAPRNAPKRNELRVIGSRYGICNF